MKQPFPPTTALLLSLVSLASCTPVTQFLLGRYQEPVTGEAPPPQPSAIRAAPPPTQAPPRPSVPPLPADTVFSHGAWQLLRTTRAAYAWTGAGERLLLFAVELRTSETCWYSQRGSGPEAAHCEDHDGPLSSIKSVRDGVEETSIFSGFDKAPWKGPVVDNPLPAGELTLPYASGESSGTIARGADNEVTLRASAGVFTLSPSKGLLVDGGEPDLYDGCADPDGTLPVIDEVRVQVGKKKCGVMRFLDGTEAILRFDRLEITIRRRNKPPNITKAREDGAKVLKMLAGMRPQLHVSGDASKTMVTLAASKPGGDAVSTVEADATVQGAHYRCQSLVNRFDPTWVQTVKAVCGSMAR